LFPTPAFGGPSELQRLGPAEHLKISPVCVPHSPLQMNRRDDLALKALAGRSQERFVGHGITQFHGNEIHFSCHGFQLAGSLGTVGGLACRPAGPQALEFPGGVFFWGPAAAAGFGAGADSQGGRRRSLPIWVPAEIAGVA